ncbi:DUF1704 domain-containing protein [Niabella pedocola]|uniref:DUF1704 domain-containing protein n=1 Tax=Niabella pedocola TaxID=1752077 RepID=A0ABS8PJZ9_9BACT|nr:tyrosine/phenylalanine carboxypeptidase domain-containing protein [Niabella pedocola]MCD2421423.1 DUF1704 domain-containing protein [Niabella pedocola]
MEDQHKKIVSRLTAALKEDRPVEMNLPGNGLLKIEKPVPFLMIHRVFEGAEDAFPGGLIKAESSFLIAAENNDDLTRLIIETVARFCGDRFKGFLLLEVWTSNGNSGAPYNIYVDQKNAIKTAQLLSNELHAMPFFQGKDKPVVKKDEAAGLPRNTFQLLYREFLEKNNGIVIGLEIAPLYINEVTGKPYPLLLRELRQAYSKALRKCFFEFIRLQTSFSIPHIQMLGTTIIDKNTLEIDRQLAAYSKLFDFLLLVTPINVAEAWQEFQHSNYSRNPLFRYRPMPVDPEIVKRKIYDLPVEEIADPTIAFLFRDKRKEIDRMLNMMQEREKHDFMLSSLQLFGPVSTGLLDMAKALLVAIEVESQKPAADKISATEFAVLARQELEWLALQDKHISTFVRVADDIEGVMVSRGVLNVNTAFNVSKQRASSLIQHEVGTHVVTYYNGRAQPLELFSIGVPGYEELQEGIAVLAEYLTGGLTNSRLRTLAARVVAVQDMISGKTFAETFSMLTEQYKFSPQVSFGICMRVYRGGGLTKDAVYLKGFLNIISYIKSGKEVKQLLIGKIREDYLPVVQELIHRNILKPPPVTPRYLGSDFEDKFKLLKQDGNIFKMIQ